MRVLTVGSFDLFHVGHVRLLKTCRTLATLEGEVVVALNPDQFIGEFKGELPVNNYDARREVLEACRFVDAVLSNEGGADAKVVIRKCLPDLLVVGSDWATRDYYKQMDFTQDWLDEEGIGLIYVPYTAGISSSKLRKHIVD